MPNNLEIVRLLADRLRRRSLPPPVAAIFHDICILDHHPLELYEQYKAYQEAGCIYFFSVQEFPRSSVAGKEDKKRRPVRTAHGGTWKPSGGGKQIKGSDVAGKMVTMVFYLRRRVGAAEKHFKTNWGLHEFTVLVGPNKFSKLTVYRLYRVKIGAARGGNPQQQQQANLAAPVLAIADHHAPSATGQALSTSSLSQQEQKKQPMRIHQIQHHHSALSDMVMPDSTNSQVQQGNRKPPMLVADCFQFPASSSEHGTVIVNPGQQPSPATASPDHFPVPEQPALIAGWDETMDDHEAPSPSQPPPVVGDQDYMSTMLNAAADGILDPFENLFLFDRQR